MYEYLIGVDGGGTGTRVVVVRSSNGAELGRGNGGPSGLMHGADKAWAAILAAIDKAFSTAGMTRPALAGIAVGLGLAGAHTKQWVADFAAKNPGFGKIVVETDAFTTLLGAHQGEPGAIVAIGTGSVGEALFPDGARREVGGWGFPSGDEGSGSWLGLRALSHIQRVLDGRAESSDFARAVIDYCGGDSHGVHAWLVQVNTTTCARLAPFVIEYASRDSVAHSLLVEAGQEIAKMAAALDPSGLMPIALCGGLAAPLNEYLPQQLSARIVKPRTDSAGGALELIHRNLQGKS